MSATPLIELLVYTTLAGACIPLGGAIACNENVRPEWLERELRHFVVALGGGVLLGAVSQVLVPEGLDSLGAPLLAGLVLLGGGTFFFALERLLAQRRAASPQLSAMLADYLPESLALGGMFAAGAKGAPLLALLIGLQNLPEGFNSWRELTDRAPRGGSGVLGRMLLLVPLGPACALAGWLWLADHPAVLGGIMLFAAGGILYLTFQDIGPQARLDRAWAPPLGAVVGFAIAAVGDMIVHGT